MKKILCLVLLFEVINPMIRSQEIIEPGKFEPAKIKDELIKKYNKFNGKLSDQTVELWDTYFLKSPNIGNMHEGRPEIGWQIFHDGTVKFVEQEYEGIMEISDLKIYPISSNIAWVQGFLVQKDGERVGKALFYDSLVKTVDGWRVILSVVSKPEFE